MINEWQKKGAKKLIFFLDLFILVVVLAPPTQVKINMSGLKKVYTITFGDVAENHAKMQKIGTLHENGYSIEKLQQIQSKLTGLGLTTEMVDLNVGFPEGFDQAKVLVIRRGAQFILGEETVGLMTENDALTMDK